MSKGQKALEIIKNAMTIYVGCASNIYTRYPFECKEIEKELKALEIIKKHYVDLDLVRCGKNYEEYNSHYETNKYYLTQEEYDLLKEVLL